MSKPTVEVAKKIFAADVQKNVWILKNLGAFPLMVHLMDTAKDFSAQNNVPIETVKLGALGEHRMIYSEHNTEAPHPEAETIKQLFKFEQLFKQKI